MCSAEPHSTFSDAVWWHMAIAGIIPVPYGVEYEFLAPLTNDRRPQGIPVLSAWRSRNLGEQSSACTVQQLRDMHMSFTYRYPDGRNVWRRLFVLVLVLVLRFPGW